MKRIKKFAASVETYQICPAIYNLQHEPMNQEIPLDTQGKYVYSPSNSYWQIRHETAFNCGDAL